MLTFDNVVNQEMDIPFSRPAPGETVFSTYILKDGVLYTTIPTSPTYTDHGSGLYTIILTLVETGQYTIFIEGDIRAYVNVTSKSSYQILQDLDDVAQGSWSYDKAAGTMELIRMNGQVLHTFNIVDTTTVTSRERL